MTNFYPGELRRLRDDINNNHDLGYKFKAIGEALDILIEVLDPPIPPDYEIAEALRGDFKKERGIEGLHFLKSMDYGMKYYCVTTEQMAGLPRKFKNLEITEPYEIDQMIEGTHTIEFPKLGKTYYTIEDLKHDWLALKLSGVER